MSTVDMKRRQLAQLLKVPGNERCADCNSDVVPEWASVTFGVFLCTACASIHRQLGVHVSRVKSLKLDNWDDAQVAAMRDMGNRKSKQNLEKYVPIYFRKPKTGDPQVLLEQWISAKYERQEFRKPLDTIYSKGRMEGYLWKRGKRDGKFARRRFILDATTGKLKYFVKEHHQDPKAEIQLASLNCNFCYRKIGNPHGLQLTFIKDGGTRSLFVYADHGKDAVDWYTGIRGAKLYHMQIAFPTTPVEDLVPFLTRDFTIEGWLWKTGPRVGDAYKKRWFILDDRKLMYLEHPLDAYPKGEILIGEKNEGYAVRVGVPPGFKYYAFGFTIVTPGRTWLMGAETEEERDRWMDAIDDVIKRPPLPTNYFGITKEMRNSFPSRNRSNSRGFFSFS